MKVKTCASVLSEVDWSASFVAELRPQRIEQRKPTKSVRVNSLILRDILLRNNYS